MLDKTWQKMYQKVKEVQGFREISNHFKPYGSWWSCSCSFV